MSQTLSTAEKLEQVTKNIIEIKLLYRSETGEAQVLHTGSGFLIGGVESAPQYILTSDKVVSVWEEEQASMPQSEGANTALEVQIVVKKDVTLNASVVTTSEDMGFAILTLEQPLYDRTYMVLNDIFESSQKSMEIFSIGVPHQEAGESTAQVSRGTLQEFQDVDGVGTWLHDSYRNSGYLGSPLVDAEGTVIGINRTVAGADTMEATLITEVFPVLDAMGICYRTTTMETEAQNAAAMAVSGNGMGGTGFNADTAFKFGGIALLVMAFVVLIVLIKTRKTRAEKKKKKEEELTVMHAAPVFEKDVRAREEAVLIRVKTGQREIVSGERFLIGKERGRTDFYIGDNSAVSRIHACICKKEDGYFLAEQQAVNGTFLNDERVYPGEEKQLNSGDRIRLADEEFTFSVSH